MIKTPRRAVFFYDHMDAPTPKTDEAKPTGPISRQTLYSIAQTYSREAIDMLVEIMRTSKNESLKLGAAKALLDKSLPDLKTTEVTGQNGEPIKLNIISGADYVSAYGVTRSTSAASTLLGSTEAESIGVAQAGPENNDSNQPDSQVESA